MAVLHSSTGVFASGAIAIVIVLPIKGFAQVPAIVSYQGRVAVAGTNFTGAGQFKFALVTANGTQTLWRNSADNNSDGQPDTAVAVAVNGGLFTIGLGDTTVAGMAVLPSAIFTNGNLSLRIWFNDGTHGFAQLTPDQLLTSSPYALMSANVPDGSITVAKFATNTASSVTSGLSLQVSNLMSQVATLASQVAVFSNQAGGSILSGATAASINPQDTSLQTLGFQLFSSIPAPGWMTSASLDSPSATTGQAGVWTGQQLLVWGGNLQGGIDSSAGAGYDPNLDDWQALPATNAPAARDQHSAIWTGQEMIVWGGAASGNYVNTGARYNPSNQVWTTLSTNNAPAGRLGHIAGWTSSRMVVWGGRNSNGLLNDGAWYDPIADQWTTMTLTNAPSARFGATIVATANSLLIWGGQDQSGALNTGAQLMYGTNGVPTAWVTINNVGAPAARTGHSAVWTGQKMLVWGGQGNGNFLTNGAAYDPVANTWSAINSANAPLGRSGHAAVWTGQEMLVFGGESSTGTLADGGAYNPVSGVWRVLSSTGAPQARSSATSVWTGTALIVFGGAANGTPVSSLQILNPQPTWYLYRKP